MNARLRQEIREANSGVVEGQIWERITHVGGAVWPTLVVVTESKGFAFGVINCMVLQPKEKRGLSFGVRADLLTDNYQLICDPINKLGYLQEKLDDYEITLTAIAESATDDPAVLKAQAELALTEKGLQ